VKAVHVGLMSLLSICAPPLAWLGAAPRWTLKINQKAGILAALGVRAEPIAHRAALFSLHSMRHLTLSLN
jgi:hypothetical protein